MPVSARFRQHGAAVIMAMLIVAIVAMVVSGVFYRQGVMARTIENTSAASQVNWLMAGAIDWVRVILKEDARATATDHLAEPWAVPLAQTRLNNDEREPAWLTGAIQDAQSRFNLRNLVGGQEPVTTEVATLERLLEVLGEDKRYADAVAALLQQSFTGTAMDAAVVRVLPGVVQDLEVSDSKLRAILDLLQPYVTILPASTPVNVNTAPAEVLAARFENLSLVDARRLVASRDSATFKDVTDALTRLGDVQPKAAAGSIDVSTRFFILDGMVEFGRARLHEQALLRRESGHVDVIWRREVST